MALPSRKGGIHPIWRLMDVADFIAHPSAVPEMQRRTGLVWADLGPGPQAPGATG